MKSEDKLRVTLKKPWISYRGKLYPSGTIFIENDIRIDVGLCSKWYDFYIPNGSRGFVLIPNSVFKKLTPEEKALKKKRQQLRDEHIAATADPFLKK